MLQKCECAIQFLIYRILTHPTLIIYNLCSVSSGICLVKPFFSSDRNMHGLNWPSLNSTVILYGGRGGGGGSRS